YQSKGRHRSLPWINPENGPAESVQLLKALAVSELLAQLPAPDRKRAIGIADIDIASREDRRLAGNNTGGGGHGAVGVVGDIIRRHQAVGERMDMTRPEIPFGIEGQNRFCQRRAVEKAGPEPGIVFLRDDLPVKGLVDDERRRLVNG